MNITDVDDKIILKARRNHLLSKFFASPPPPSDVLDRVRHGILSTTTKLQVMTPQQAASPTITLDMIRRSCRPSWTN
jgi:cysteinyl-tRNA synthetase